MTEASVQEHGESRICGKCGQWTGGEYVCECPGPTASVQDTVKVYRLTIDGTTLTCDSMDPIAAEVEATDEEMSFTLSVGTMSRADFDALEEFNGW